VTGFRRRLLGLILSAGATLFLYLQSPLAAEAQLSTNDHLADPGFWPTKNDAPRNQYAGAATCTSCHGAIAASQKGTSMSQTSIRADNAGLLHSHPMMRFAFGPYRYEIKTARTGSTYTVSDGKRTQAATLLWTFGTGRVGQSYLFKKEDGKFYEARVTYFSTLHTLGFTPDRALTSAKSVEEAMYRPVDAAEVERCFACHTTASAVDGRVDEKNLIPGVSCEACHGPGAKHASAMSLAKITGDVDLTAPTPFNPAHLSPTDSVDFCGACHSTWWDVKLAGIRGVSNVKAQPYRLENSKCWGKGDARLTCIACHDPHVELQTDSASYDKACLSCHVNSSEKKTSAEFPGAACRVSTKDCVSCHMPKVYVPEMHFNFTDHRIRIPHAGEPYPD